MKKQESAHKTKRFTHTKALPPVPARWVELRLPPCCAKDIRRFMYKFLATTAENREFLFTLTASEGSFKITDMNRRKYFRKLAMVRTEFIPADTPDCCRETILEFLDFFRDCTPSQRELIVHVIKGGKLSNFSPCCRRTAGLWVQGIVARNPKFSFLHAIIRRQEEWQIALKHRS